ncbi:hypothetical protein, conserved [Leishmania tarentolae]|uniref:Uncharacterized protein n=1 Tax=Leishmania tarentolae TaxID=5689 RepID=A0A640KIQ3_LEITA|nr:hypothetical protein, conserved [Leishmania tarentolae]
MRSAPTWLAPIRAASLSGSQHGSRAYHLAATDAAGWRRCRCFAGVSVTTAHAVSPSVSALPSSLSTARRTYYWPYPENLVPEGATTSPFQSSPVPSVRERIIREYALGPLFGSRTPCCVLGFAGTARDVMSCKGDVRRYVARALGKSEADVELGGLVQAKEMLLHRSGTDESPRLGDGPGSRPDAAQRRLTRYARLPVQARTLLEVYLPGEEHGDVDAAEDADATILAHGYFLQEQLYRCMATAASSGPAPIGLSSSEGRARDDTIPEIQWSRADDNGRNDEADVESSVASLHDACGVVYCEVPMLDESDFFFNQLCGKDVDGDTVERVTDRWTRRMMQQQPQL